MVEEKYEIIELIGDGSFGQVYWAKEKETLELVAIKRLKDHIKSWEDAMSQAEVKCLI
jgi:serine/threonine protein kinase